MIPLQISTAIKAIDGIFQNDGDPAVNDFKKSLRDLKTWLKARINSMYDQCKDLEDCIAK